MLILKLKLQYFGHLMRRADSFEKTLMLGKTEARRRRGSQKTRWLDGITDSMAMRLRKHQEMVRWHHQLNGHEFEQTPGDNEGQGSLECCSPQGCKQSDMT